LGACYLNAKVACDVAVKCQGRLDRGAASVHDIYEVLRPRWIMLAFHFLFWYPLFTIVWLGIFFPPQTLHWAFGMLWAVSEMMCHYFLVCIPRPPQRKRQQVLATATGAA
jgi:hypothetical protein